MNPLASLRNTIENRKGQRDQIIRSLDDLKAKAINHHKDLKRHNRALEAVRHVGLLTQRQLEYRLSEQTGLAMEAVFDDPYALKVAFIEKRGKTEVELLFVRRGLEFTPIGSAGGGAIDVAALALQIAYWSMRRDKQVRPVLILDEPLARLKGEAANRRALAMIQEVSESLGLQIIMVSDERVSREDIADNADQLIWVTQRKGKSSAVSINQPAS